MKRKLDCLDYQSSGISGSTPQCFEPIVCGVQLVGDSMLLRLSRFIAQKTAQRRSGTSFSRSCDEQRDKPFCRPYHSTMRRRLGSDSSMHSSAFNTTILLNSASTDTKKDLKTDALNNSTTEVEVIINSTTEIDMPIIDPRNDSMENKTEKRICVQAGEKKNEIAYLNTQTMTNTFSYKLNESTSNEALTLKTDPFKTPGSENSSTGIDTSVSEIYSPSQSINVSVDDLMNRSSTDSVNQSVDDSINESENDYVNETVNDSIEESLSESTNDSINETVTDSMDKSLNESINNSDGEAINVVLSKTVDELDKTSTEEASRPTAKQDPVYLCISGQSLWQLLHQLRWLEQQQPPVKMVNQVLLMCGTNDLKKRARLAHMQTNMEKIVTILKKFTKELVVLTLPPIPACDTQQDYCLLTDFNKFLKSKLTGVKVVDIYPLFVKRCNGRWDGGYTNGNIRVDLYERYLGNPRRQRTDLVHWNFNGMDVIHSHLCEMGIFEEPQLQEQKIKDNIDPKKLSEQTVNDVIAQHVLFQQDVKVEKTQS